jgi:hypothetical protein
MLAPSWKTTIVVSWALAAGGTLACVAAIFDYAVPGGSVLRALATLAALVLAIGGVVVGFARVCEGCEEYFNGDAPQRRRQHDQLVIRVSEQRMYDYAFRKPRVAPASRDKRRAIREDWSAPRRNAATAVKQHRGQ